MFTLESTEGTVQFYCTNGKSTDYFRDAATLGLNSWSDGNRTTRLLREAPELGTLLKTPTETKQTT